jgi:Predicted dehydrogenases and related proteins
MNPDKIRVAIVGCGHRLRDVAQRLVSQKTSASARIEIVALHDPSPRSVAAARAAVAPDAAGHADLDSLLARQDIDWVMIGSWNCAHADQIVAALRAGKHVFAEKPLATTLEDCLRIRAALEAAPDRRFFFGLVLRYAPIYRKIKELLQAGVVGRPVSFEFNETLDFNHGGYIHGNWRRHRRFAGTHLLEKCCHDFDLVNWLLESVPVRAASFGGRDVFTPANKHLADEVAPAPDGRAPYLAWVDPERVDPFSDGASIVDNQVAILEYANGVRATFHTNCHAALRERRIYLLGTRGAIRADAITGRIEWQRIGFDTPVEAFELPARGSHAGADDVMARHLAETMVNGAAPLATLDDGLRAAVACLGVDDALDTASVVDLRPLWDRAGVAL